MNKTTLTDHELGEYRRRLRELVTRLGGEVAGLEREALRPAGAEAAEGPPETTVHEADQGARQGEEELALDLLGPEEHVLAEATSALARIEQGTFGRCEGCGHLIAKDRLDALPYARRCIRCAREAEAV